MQGERYQTKLECETVQENNERSRGLVFLYFQWHPKEIKVCLSPVLFRIGIDGSGTQQAGI